MVPSLPMPVAGGAMPALLGGLPYSDLCTSSSDLPRVGGSVGTSGSLEITSSSSGLLSVSGSSPCMMGDDLRGIHNTLMHAAD